MSTSKQAASSLKEKIALFLPSSSAKKIRMMPCRSSTRDSETSSSSPSENWPKSKRSESWWNVLISTPISAERR